MGGRVTRLSGSRLLLFNVCASSVAYAVGDKIQQRFEGRRTVDWRRCGRMACLGAVVGAQCNYWYLFLDRILPGLTRRVVVRKVLADMIIFGPISLCTFFVGIGALEGKKSKGIAQDLKTLLPTAYLLEWTVWPAAQAINFYLVPIQMRVFYVSSILIVWTVILSYVKHRDSH